MVGCWLQWSSAKSIKWQTEAVIFEIGDFVQIRVNDPRCFFAVEILTDLLLKFPLLCDLRHIATERDGAVYHLNLSEHEEKSQSRVKFIHSQERVLNSLVLFCF